MVTVRKSALCSEKSEYRSVASI